MIKQEAPFSAIKDIGFSQALQDYSHRLFLKEAPVLYELRQHTKKMPEGHMQITPLQGQFLGFLMQILGPKKVLEIGTYTGYSSLVMALSLPKDGTVLTCDRNPEWTKIAKKYWALAGVETKIELILGQALETQASLIKQGQTFDFILIDADKKNYRAYYENSLQLLKKGGVVAIDNVLWGGNIMEQSLHDPI